MPIRFKDDVMGMLKNAGWSEYKLRREKRLSAATIKAIKTGVANVSVRSVAQICELLGGVQPDTVLEYFDIGKNPRAGKPVLTDRERHYMLSLYFKDRGEDPDAHPIYRESDYLRFLPVPDDWA